MLRLLLILVFFFLKTYAGDHPLRCVGIYGELPDKGSRLTHHAIAYLPYNPIVVEVGGYKGDNTVFLSEKYPKGRVITFEPNPKAFDRLLFSIRECKNVAAYNVALNSYNGSAMLHINHGIYCDNENLEGSSSILWEDPRYPCFKGPDIEVPCVVLDDWCKQNDIDHIDFIHLDCEGLELQILQSSPEILKTVLVICTRVNFCPFRQGTSLYDNLTAYLESCGFRMLALWYREGLQGEATFIRNYVYDALYN